MAELATYIGIVPQTIKVGASALARGVRVSLDSGGLATVTDASTRGDFITLQAGAIGEFIAAAPMSDGGAVPALAGEASCDQGDLAYSYAGGAVGVTSSGAVIVGRWRQTTASGKLGSIQLFTAA